MPPFIGGSFDSTLVSEPWSINVSFTDGYEK